MKSFFKSNLFKVILFLLLFAVLVAIGCWLFYWGWRFRRRTWFLRGTYMAIAVAWAIFSSWWVAARFGFAKYWRGMIADFWSRQESTERDLYKEYQDLMNSYPMAVAAYESSCWKKDPRPTSLEIMEEALSISEEEWAEREKLAREKLAEKNNK